MADYQRGMARLLRTHGEGGDPPILTFTPEARDPFGEFRRMVERDMGELGRLSQLTDWAGKLPGAVARIAGLLHLAMHPQERTVVGLETVAVAIELGHYFIDHALAAFAMMGADEDVARAEHLLKWIARRGWTEFTKRDLFEAAKGHGDFRKADDLDAPLRLLEAHEYIAFIPQEHTGPGKRPSPRFTVNPRFAEFA